MGNKPGTEALEQAPSSSRLVASRQPNVMSGVSRPSAHRPAPHQPPLPQPQCPRRALESGATSSPCSSTASTPTGDQVISNWKLFNDLENREEAEALELSLFLDALVNYIPGLDGGKQKEASDARPMFQPETGNIDIVNVYVQGNELDNVITLENVENVIDSCRNGRKIPRNVVVRVVTEVTTLLRQSPTVVEFTIAPAKHVTIIGDLHGQLDDLLLILRENGLPSRSNPYVFNGDFVDRGDRSVEIAVIIYLFKLLFPHHVMLNRGNHEENSTTQMFGFMKECDVKYDRYVYNLFCESFCYLPLATLIDDRVLVVHGGVPRDNMLIRDLNTLDRAGYDLTRYREKPKCRKERELYRKMQIMRDMLWSDPKETKGYEENKRGAGTLYGPDVVEKFMTKNKLALVVRSHECIPQGFDWPYKEKGMLVTLFSASNYCGKANNLGCFMHIPSGKGKPAFFQYMANAESRDMAVSNLDALFSLIVQYRSDLVQEFEDCDQEESGKVTVEIWGAIMEDVLDLSLDWNTLQPLLTVLDEEGLVPYYDFLDRYNAMGTVTCTDDDGKTNIVGIEQRSAFNSLYRHRSRLEALFRVLDRDGNGTISVDELENGIKLVNEHLPPGTKPFSTNAMDYMRIMDFGHDNEININEFMEGFRINATLTVHAKWKRARKKMKALSAMGALQGLSLPNHATAAASGGSGELAHPVEVIETDDEAEWRQSRKSDPNLKAARSRPLAPWMIEQHGSVQVVSPSISATDKDEDGASRDIYDSSDDEGGPCRDEYSSSKDKERKDENSSSDDENGSGNDEDGLTKDANCGEEVGNIS